ncbi:MAG: FAS1-like dehydratase domain-containing protein, partial [Trebonia sp.]
MGLDHSLVGVPSEPQLRSWDSMDALLYAVGVGAGLGSPLEELEFTTENCEGIEQRVLPTFAVLIAQARAGRSLGDFDRAMLVHAEQSFELHRPLPVAGTVRTVSTVTGIYDKGSGALVVSENAAVDAVTGEP